MPISKDWTRAQRAALRATQLSPLPFVEFATGVLRVDLSPGQRVLCLVAFDGVQPRDLSPADRELSRQIFGDCDTIPDEARHVLAALCGARAGKSYILCGLRLLHLALTVSLDTLAPGELAAGIIVGPDIRLARQTLRYVAGAANSASTIKPLIATEAAENVTIRRADGKTVDLVCLPATRGGSAVRGRSLVGAALDEACFFRDANYQVNDVELFKAVAPRIVPGGQAIIASTPWAQLGLLYELYERNHGHPVDAIAAHAPTTVLRDDERTRQLVERERERDPDNAAREFDAVPMASDATEFFDAPSVAAAIDEAAPDVLGLLPNQTAMLGLDTGFRKDPSAGVVVRRNGDGYEVSECVEVAPKPGERLKPSETLRQLFERGQRHRCVSAVSDQHYIETVREHCGYLRLHETPAGVEGNAEMYTTARTVLREGRLKISAQHTRLLSQLRQVVAKPTPGGNISIQSPRRGGAHGDLASALVAALWALEQEKGGSAAVRVTTPSTAHPERERIRPKRGAWR